MLVLQVQEWEKCSYAHRQVDEQPSKRSEKNGDKSAVAMLKKHELYDRTERPVVCRCVQDIRKPILCVKFTNAIARHTEIRDQNPSLGYICPGEPHQRCSNTPKFEDRSQEEPEWQE